jgi:hypothetical protein
LIGFMTFLTVLVSGVWYEERLPGARFGEAYRAYRSNVSRWIGPRGHQEPRAGIVAKQLRAHATNAGSVEPWPWWAHLVSARSIHIDEQW